jgi:hypothetical protein
VPSASEAPHSGAPVRGPELFSGGGLVFTRLCVDLDKAGNVAGSSYELHDEDGIASFGTALVEPFETPEEAFADLLATHRHQIGSHQSLF